MLKIFVVEDDIKLREELKIFLNNNGYEIETLYTFDNTINDIINSNSDLILLDINIPNLNGEKVLKEIRKTSNVPVIMLTSKNTEIDELLSINYGADDFIAKPYNPQILLARIERLLKRANNNQIIVKYEDLHLNASKFIITKGDEIFDFSKNEFKIFYFLLINRGKIVTRNELMEYLWDTDTFIDDNTLTVNINRLRNHLEELGYSNIVKTKRGEGYIIL